MMDLVSGLAAIKGALTCLQGLSTALKMVKETDQKIAQYELKEQLAELKEKLLEARDVTSELILQNQDLSQRLKRKEEMQLQEDGNILWRMEGEEKKGPYCSTCYGAEDKLISLNGSDPGAWNCPKCKNHFHTKQWAIDRLRSHENLNRGCRSC
jgi:hypothetical protein